MNLGFAQKNAQPGCGRLGVFNRALLNWALQVRHMSGSKLSHMNALGFYWAFLLKRFFKSLAPRGNSTLKGSVSVRRGALPIGMTHPLYL